MSSRQYGQYGSPYGYPKPPYAYTGTSGTRTPVSPVSANASMLSLPRGYAPSAPSTAPPSPPKRAVQPYDIHPVPQHRKAPSSPTRYRRQSVAASSRNSYDAASQAPTDYSGRPASPAREQRMYTVASASRGYGAVASPGAGLGRSETGAPEPPRHMHGFSNPLQDIDNLYGGRMMSPSPEPPEPQQRSYGQPPANYPHIDYRPANVYPPYERTEQKVLKRPRHQATDSQNSVAPLLPQGQTTPPRKARLPGDSPPGTHRRQRSIPVMEAAGYNNSPYGHHGQDYQGDGYDADPAHIHPEQAHHDGHYDFEDQPMHQRSAYPGRADALAAGTAASGNEKSEWLDDESRRRKKMRWIIIGVIALILIAAIVGGVVGGNLGSKKSNDKGGSTSGGGHGGTHSGGLYDIDSTEVQALLNNDNLHRVFPGMDYTPLNAQYPDCLTNGPDQNNITLDLAMLSQLTPAVRLYGTDCNQTEMVLEGINRLGYNDTLKVWLGVWLGTNATTNSRQLNQMYNILDTYPCDHFAGVIVGNEVLFREDLTEAQLGANLTAVRAKLAAKNIDLPVATSDLGDDWTSALAADTDIVMANIHPFFAGVTPDKAPGWSWNFWQDHDVMLTGAAASNGSATYPKHIISEIGWPSEGGNDCGTNGGNEVVCPSDTAGAVASIDNMNSFMDGWVCQSMTNGTTYFWFEAFDEPWKEIFNTDTDQWESKWGLMDVNRNLKPGLKIPDCGGQTVDRPY